FYSSLLHCSYLPFFLHLLPRPTSTPFPYTTLFRSYPARYVGVDPIEIVFIQLGKVGGIPFRQDAGTGRGAKRSLYFFFSPTLPRDRKSTRLNSSHGSISYAVFCLKQKSKQMNMTAH